MIEIIPKSHEPGNTWGIAISVLNDFVLDMEVKSLLGHRTKIKDLPKLRQILISKIKFFFIERFVYPHRYVIPLPVFQKKSPKFWTNQQLFSLSIKNKMSRGFRGGRGGGGFRGGRGGMAFQGPPDSVVGRIHL